MIAEPPKKPPGGDSTTEAIRRDPVPKMPMPLSTPQEAEVRELYHKRVRAKCADEIREFAQCCTGRSFSLAWACKPQKKLMDACMVQYANEKEKDAARAEWFATASERRAEKREAERKTKIHEKLHKEYWGEFNTGNTGSKPEG